MTVRRPELPWCVDYCGRPLAVEGLRGLFGTNNKLWALLFASVPGRSARTAQLARSCATVGSAVEIDRYFSAPGPTLYTSAHYMARSVTTANI
jgi:hypothetical protein